MGLGQRKRFLVMERDSRTCQHCGRVDAEDLQVDHIVPVSRGGGDELSNLQVLCARCNQAKGASTMDEFLSGKLHCPGRECDDCGRCVFVLLGPGRKCGQCLPTVEAMNHGA